MREAGIFNAKNALGNWGLSGQGDPCTTADTCGTNPPCDTSKPTCNKWGCYKGSCSYQTVANPGQKYPSGYGCFSGNDCQSGFCNTAVPVAGMKGQCQVKGQVNPTIGGGGQAGAFCDRDDMCDQTKNLWCDKSISKCSGDVTDYPCAHVDVVNYVLDVLGLPQNGAWTQAAQDQLAKSGLSYQGIATGCKLPVPVPPKPGTTQTTVPVVKTPVTVTAKKPPAKAPGFMEASLFGIPLWALLAGVAVIGGAVVIKSKKKKAGSAASSSAPLAPNRRRRRHHR